MPSPAVRATGASLRLDALAVEVCATLADNDIETIVLKGPAVATWLYGDGGLRPYVDIDLLVDPRRSDAAAAVLASLGFVDVLDGAAPSEYAAHARVFARGRGEEVDLHRALPWVKMPPRQAWDILSAWTDPLLVAGRQLTALAPPARAFHVALHAAQHGPGNDRALDDMARALDVLPAGVWRDALRVARQLEAVPLLAAGLRLVEEGRRMAAELGLPSDPSTGLASASAATPLVAFGLDGLLSTPTIRGKVRRVARELVPTPAFMRLRYPVARRGPAGLALAYARRPLSMVGQLPAAWKWARARAAARGWR